MAACGHIFLGADRHAPVLCSFRCQLHQVPRHGRASVGSLDPGAFCQVSSGVQFFSILSLPWVPNPSVESRKPMERRGSRGTALKPLFALENVQQMQAPHIDLQMRAGEGSWGTREQRGSNGLHSTSSASVAHVQLC